MHFELNTMTSEIMPASSPGEFKSPPTIFDPATCNRKGLCPVTQIHNQAGPFESHTLYFEVHGSGPEKVVFIMGCAILSMSPEAPAQTKGGIAALILVHPDGCLRLTISGANRNTLSLCSTTEVWGTAVLLEGHTRTSQTNSCPQDDVTSSSLARVGWRTMLSLCWTT